MRRSSALVSGPLLVVTMLLAACSGDSGDSSDTAGSAAPQPTQSSANPVPDPAAVTLTVGSATAVSLGCEVGSFGSITPWETEITLVAEGGQLTLTSGEYVNGPVPIKAGELLPRAAVIVEGAEYELVATAPIAQDIGTNQQFAMPPVSAPFSGSTPESAELEYMLLDHTVVDITCSGDRTPNTDAPTPAS